MKQYKNIIFHLAPRTWYKASDVKLNRWKGNSTEIQTQLPRALCTHIQARAGHPEMQVVPQESGIWAVFGGSSSVLESARSIPTNYHILELLPKNSLRQTLIFYKESVAKHRVSKAFGAALKQSRSRIQSEFVLCPGKECVFQFGVPRHFLPPTIWGTWDQSSNLTEPVSSSLKIEWEPSKWLGRTKNHNSGARPLSPQKCSYRSGCVVDQEEGGDRVRQSLHSSLILKPWLRCIKWDQGPWRYGSDPSRTQARDGHGHTQPRAPYLTPESHLPSTPNGHAAGIHISEPKTP